MKFTIFGCKVNKFYLNTRLGFFARRGTKLPANSHLVATCVVTDRAKAKWLKYVEKLLKAGDYVYLTGCGAFEKGQAMEYEKFYGIYPSLKPYHDQLTLLGEDPKDFQDDISTRSYELNTEHGFEAIASDAGDETTHNEFTKKFIVIQSGCDTFCTFCLTIYKRGSNRNRDADEIIAEIDQFVASGGKEIVITGVNLAARGASNTRRPKESQFSHLLERILNETTVPRIRISSLGPEFLTDHFFELMKHERFLPHFHFSIQHFSDPVLKLMNRNYDAKILDYCLQSIRKLERDDREYISIGADLIVGFPGETEEDFQQMLQAVETYGITKLHAFPFSAHQKGESVPAGKLPNQVPQHIKLERMQRLLEVGDRVRQHFLDTNKGKSRPVLVEAVHKGKQQGLTPNYIDVELEPKYQRGEIIEVVL